jgi:hypothetical protein
MSNRPQYDLYNNNTTSIPNIYFLSSSEQNYDRSSDPQDYINPVSIKNNCSNQNDGLNLIDSTNDEDELLMTRGNGYNNFLWKYATNQLTANTAINESSNSVSTYSDIKTGAKNQLEYLGCQVLKNSNKIYDKNSLSSFKIDQTTGPWVAAVLAFIALNATFFVRSFCNSKSSWTNFYEKIGKMFSDNLGSGGSKIGMIIWLFVCFLIVGGILFYGSLSNYFYTDESNGLGTDYKIFTNDVSGNTSSTSGLSSATAVIIFAVMILFVILFVFKFYSKFSDKGKMAAYSLPILLIVAIYAANYLGSNVVSRWFTVSEPSPKTNTCKNINEQSYDNTKVISFLLVLYVICILFYFGLLILSKGGTSPSLGKMAAMMFLYPFAIILPLVLFMFEFSFAMLQPIIYFITIIVIRIAIYLFSFIGKSAMPKITAVLFNYPESYFRKMSDENIKINYPTTLPSGASWNTISVLILKIFYLIFSAAKPTKVTANDFNIFNSLNA